MADILSQDEVDMLLDAVADGDVAVEEKPQKGVGAHDTMPYDFRRPERVSKEQLKGLQSLFEMFSRELSIALPPFLRAVVRVDLVSVDQLTYDEFILSISRPTSMSVINMAPLDGNAVIELNPAVVFPIVDRILGGKGDPLGSPRELTEIEDRIMHRIVLMILDSLRRSWDQLVDFKLSVVTQESDPLIVQIVAGSEMVILVCYEMHIGTAVGSMNMCIPLVVLAPVLDQISQQTRFTRRMAPRIAELTRQWIDRTLRKATVPVDAILGRTERSLDEIARLQVGDFLSLDSPVKDPIQVEIAGLPRYTARPVRRGDHGVVQLIDIIQDT